MKFYQSISKYYDYVFPYKPVQFRFIESFAEIKGKKILDIGCGSGSLAINLTEAGGTVNAIDYEEEMIRLAIGKCNHEQTPAFMQLDMKEITEAFLPSSFDIIYCFGNTLVHLNDSKEVYKFIESCKLLLKPDGILMIQILNYEYILKNKVNSLPLIENEHIKFERYYENPEAGQIDFITKLTVKNSDKLIQNSVKLFPLTKTELLQQLNKIGFTDIEYFGNFKKDKAEEDSLPFIVKATHI